MKHFFKLSLCALMISFFVGGNFAFAEEDVTTDIAEYRALVEEYRTFVKEVKSIRSEYKDFYDEFLLFVRASEEDQLVYAADAQTFLIGFTESSLGRLEAAKMQLQIVEAGSTNIELSFDLTIEDIDALIANLTASLETLQAIDPTNENAPEEIIAVARSVRNDWKEVKEVLADAFHMFVVDAADHVIVYTNEKYDEVSSLVDAAELEGIDVEEMRALLAEMEETLNEVQADFDEAVAIFEAITPETENKKDELLAAHAKLQEAHAGLREARRTYREIKILLKTAGV